MLWLDSVCKAALSANACCFFIEQKSIKPEKEGEEKVKKPRFPSILGPPRRLSRVDSTSGWFLKTHTQSNKDASYVILHRMFG